MKKIFRLSALTILLIFASFEHEAYAKDLELDFEIQNDFFFDYSDDGIYRLFATTN